MSIRDLENRLDKIRDPQKLLNFQIMAREYYASTGDVRYRQLEDRAATYAVSRNAPRAAPPMQQVPIYRPGGSQPVAYRRRGPTEQNLRREVDYNLLQPDEFDTPIHDSAWQEEAQCMAAVEEICTDSAFGLDGLARDEDGNLVRQIRFDK